MHNKNHHHYHRKFLFYIEVPWWFWSHFYATHFSTCKWNHKNRKGISRWEFLRIEKLLIYASLFLLYCAKKGKQPAMGEQSAWNANKIEKDGRKKFDGELVDICDYSNDSHAQTPNSSCDTEKWKKIGESPRHLFSLLLLVHSSSVWAYCAYFYENFHICPSGENYFLGE